MADADVLGAKLRAWAANMDTTDQAAVELLISVGGWLHRSDFTAACVVRHGPVTAIDWHQAREFSNRVASSDPDTPHASTSQAAILDLAVTLGEDRFRFGIMGRVHSRAIAEAVAQAVGLPG